MLRSQTSLTSQILQPRLSQTIHHLKTTVINSNLSIARQKTNSSNLNPATVKITTIHSPWIHVGPDNVHYQMLKHLPNDALLTLLNILNDIWASGKFPTSWCTLQLYQFLNLVKIHLTLVTIAQLLSQGTPIIIFNGRSNKVFISYIFKTNTFCSNVLILRCTK